MPFWPIQFTSFRHLSLLLSGHHHLLLRSHRYCGLHFRAMLSSIRQQIDKQMDAPDAPFQNLIRGYRIGRRKCSHKFGPPGGHVCSVCMYVCVCRFENNNGIVHSNEMPRSKRGNSNNRQMPNVSSSFSPCLPSFCLLVIVSAGKATPRVAQPCVRMFFASAPKYRKWPQSKKNYASNEKSA